MGLLDINYEPGSGMRFTEIFDIRTIYGAADCNENMAKSRIYNLTNPNTDNPIRDLTLKLKGLVDSKSVFDFGQVELWVDVCKELVQVRCNGKMRIGITKRFFEGQYWDKYTGPELYVKAERRGTRKKNHWYSMVGFSIRAIDTGWASTIINSIDCPDDPYVYFYTDEHGNFIRES